MKRFVITYTEKLMQYEVIWHGSGANEALKSFWASFDEVDIKRVSDVKIFELVEIRPVKDDEDSRDMTIDGMDRYGSVG